MEDVYFYGFTFKKYSILKNIFIPFIILLLSYQSINSNACTIIVVDKNATADGSVIVSHTQNLIAGYT
jgi:hypothetical protein